MSRMTGHQHMDDAFGSKGRLTYMQFRHFPSDGRRHDVFPGFDLDLEDYFRD